MKFYKYNKIIVVGCSGSGKSWFSKKLAEKTGYKLIHLDNEFWKPDWVQTPRDEWIIRQKELIEEKQWIIDGNYNGTLELRFTASDLIVFLDINRYICILSALMRMGKKRSDLPEYLNEPKLFSKGTLDFYKWIWIFPKKGRKTILDLHEKYPEKEFLHIKSRKEMNKILAEEIKCKQ